MRRHQIPKSRPSSAGQRQYPLVVEQMTESAGPSGFPVETWSILIKPYWCERADVEGQERASDQIIASSNTIWNGPYRAELDPDLVDVPKTRRLRYGGRVFDVVAAFRIGARTGIEWLTLARSG